MADRQRKRQESRFYIPPVQTIRQLRVRGGENSYEPFANKTRFRTHEYAQEKNVQGAKTFFFNLSQSTS